MGDEGLAGLRVVQIGGGVAPGYATRLLADLGAAVTRVEPPTGDPLRHLGPVPSGDPRPDSALFRYLAAGSGSVVADLAAAEGRAAVLDAVREHDAEPVLVIEALGAGRLEAHDLGPEALADGAPGVALVRIAPVGQTGPLAHIEATDLVLQALGGWVSDHGDPGSDPVRVGGRIASWVVGAYAAVAGLTAVRGARRSGRPVTADLSAQECLVGTLAYPMLLQRTLRQIGAPTGGRRYVVPGIVPCADGWVGVNALTGQHWQDICVLFETPAFDGRQQELLGDERAYQAFLSAARPWLEVRRAEEIVDICQAFRVPAAPVGDGHTLPDLGHFASRRIYRTTDDGLRLPRPPHRFGGEDDPPPVRPAPELGEQAPRSLPPWPRRRIEDDGNGDRPFAGLRVVDLSIFWAGPYVTMYLASLGADVVKIESPTRPDGFRFVGTFPQLGDDWYERSLVWQATNLGKRSLTLDLQAEAGLDVLWTLLDTADVLIENFAPRVAEGFGLTGDAVAARCPEVVYLRMPGFGLDGPWRDHVGWAMSYEQASGAAAVTGFADRPPLNPGGFADPVVGMHAAVALHAALVDRERTGRGGLVEIPQIEVLTAITAEQVAGADLAGAAPGRTGNRSDEAPLEGVFAGADGRWLALSVRGEPDWLAVSGVAEGCPELAEMPWSQAVAEVDRTEARLAAWVAGTDVPSLAARLREVGVPAAAVLDVPRMVDDPQLAHRGWYETLDHPVTGSAPYPGWPFRLDSGPDHVHRRPAPMLGQHSDEILQGASVDTAGRRRLREDGVTGVGLP